MILLVASNKDIASLNIKKQILNNIPSKKPQKYSRKTPFTHANLNGKNITLATLNEESVNAQNLPENFPEAEMIVFISRHSSASGKPTLSVHTPGNFAEAGLGGLPKTVSVSPATAMQRCPKSAFTLQRRVWP